MDNTKQHVGVITTRPDTDTTITGAQVEALDDRPEVYHAQGMVMVQLNVNLVDALTRMRTYAYVHHRRLWEVAEDVVARRLRFGPVRS